VEGYDTFRFWLIRRCCEEGNIAIFINKIYEGWRIGSSEFVVQFVQMDQGCTRAKLYIFSMRIFSRFGIVSDAYILYAS
jgi:hypothetical protein